VSKNDHWTEERLQAYLAGFNRVAISTTYVEPDSKHGPAAKNVDKEVYPRFRIHIHSKRRRFADPDGVSAKAAIDGLVKGGILRDDSSKYISEVTFTQELSTIEETVIEIWQIK
jgi:hypothetical protein